jgi:phage N-6-adenine-methyltransferase
MADKMTSLLRVDGKKKDWATPLAFIEYLEGLGGLAPTFTLDAAASEHNAKAPKYYDKETDGLKQSWKNETVWLNPPYGADITDWLVKCVESMDRVNEIWVLVPARTDTKWFHEWVLPYAQCVYFIKGRLNFESGAAVKNSTAPFPSMLIWYHPTRYKDPDHFSMMASLEPTLKERGFNG